MNWKFGVAICALLLTAACDQFAEGGSYGENNHVVKTDPSLNQTRTVSVGGTVYEKEDKRSIVDIAMLKRKVEFQNDDVDISVTPSDILVLDRGGYTSSLDTGYSKKYNKELPTQFKKDGKYLQLVVDGVSSSKLPKVEADFSKGKRTERVLKRTFSLERIKGNTIYMEMEKRLNGKLVRKVPQSYSIRSGATNTIPIFFEENENGALAMEITNLTATSMTYRIVQINH